MKDDDGKQRAYSDAYFDDKWNVWEVAFTGRGGGTRITERLEG